MGLDLSYGLSSTSLKQSGQRRFPRVCAPAWIQIAAERDARCEIGAKAHGIPVMLSSNPGMVIVAMDGVVDQGGRTAGPRITLRCKLFRRDPTGTSRGDSAFGQGSKMDTC